MMKSIYKALLWGGLLASPLAAQPSLLDIIDIGFPGEFDIPDGHFMAGVLIAPSPGVDTSLADCSVYSEGKLLQRGQAQPYRYISFLPLEYFFEKISVSCSHPYFRPVGADFEPSFTNDLLIRGAVVAFTEKKIIEETTTRYNPNGDIAGVDVKVKLPKPELKKVDLPGFGTFDRLTFNTPEVQLLQGSEFESMPEVPVVSPLVAIPKGSRITNIRVQSANVEVLQGVRLYPVQATRSEAKDYKDINANPYDEKIYKNSKINIGSQIYNEDIFAGNYRIQKLAGYLVNYEPASGRLEIPRDLTISYDFVANSDCYGDASRNLDPVRRLFDQMPPAILNQTVNYTEVQNSKDCGPQVVEAASPQAKSLSAERLSVARPEFVVVTHSKFNQAADRLVQHKKNLGWYAQKVNADNFTIMQIKAKLNALDPQWVVMMGDAEFIATHYHRETPYVINRFDRSFGAGDGFLAQGDDDRLNPGNFSIGRIPVDTAEQANEVVNKLISYELNPPLEPEFYARPSWSANLDYAKALESFFQETARSYGLSPRRLYYAGSDPIPAEFDYLMDSDTNWNASASDINQAMNDSITSVFLHRGHADWFGWEEPRYKVADVAKMSVEKTNFPFLLSINCSSGFFDNETAAAFAVPPSPPRRGATDYAEAKASDVTLAEAMIRQPKGAIAVIADSRSSDHILNQTMANAAMDSIYQNLRSQEAQIDRGRLGRILQEAKAAVVSNHTSVREIGNHLLIYNLFGDPSMYLHQRVPAKVVDFEFDQRNGNGRFRLDESACQACSRPEKDPVILTVQANGEILGRAIASFKGGDETYKEYSFSVPSVLSQKADALSITAAALVPYRQGLRPTAKPNLKVSISGDSYLNPGSNPGRSLVVTVTNVGQQTAKGTLPISEEAGSGGYMVDFVLSSDQVLPNKFAIYSSDYREDVLLRGGRMSRTQDLAPGQSAKFTMSNFEIPFNTPNGSYCMGVVVDPGNSVDESSESDNTDCLQVQIFDLLD